MLARCGGRQIGDADANGQKGEVDQYADQVSDTLPGCGAWMTLLTDHTMSWEHSSCGMRIRTCQSWPRMVLGSLLSTCSDVANPLDLDTCSCSMDQHSGCSCRVPCSHIVRVHFLGMRKNRHTSEAVLAGGRARLGRAENSSALTHLNHSRLLLPAQPPVRAWA